MTIVEKAYEEWQHCDKKTIQIGNDKYYRIVYSELFKLSTMDREFLCVVLSPDMPIGKNFEDENGNHFTFDGFHFIKFIRKVPQWYLKFGQCSLKWVETKEIGEYLKVLN